MHILHDVRDGANRLVSAQRTPEQARKIRLQALRRPIAHWRVKQGRQLAARWLAGNQSLMIGKQGW